MKTMLYAGIAACSLAFSSCGESQTDAAKGPAKDDLKVLDAVSLAQQDLAAGKIASLWDGFPATYQSDVEGLIHGFAGKVDADVYNEAITTVSGLNSLLKGKKDILISLLNERAPEGDKKELNVLLGGYDDITALLDTVLSTNIKDVDSLKGLKIEEMTGKVQPKLIKVMDVMRKVDPEGNPMALLKNANNELVSEDGNSAVIKVTIEDQVEEMKLTRVEQRWVPAEMAEEWKEKLAEATQSLSKIEEMQPTEKEQILSAMRMVQASIKELEGANTKEDMMAVMEKQAQTFGPMFFGLMSAMSK